MADLLLDMDGCVADFHGHLFALYAARYGVVYLPDTFKEHDLVKTVGWPVYRMMVEIFNEPEFFREIPPYPGAVEIVNRLLDDGHTIEICTSPTSVRMPDGTKRINPHCLNGKMDWVARHMPRLSKCVTVTKTKRRVRGDALADDSGHNILPWCEAHPSGTGLVVERPWNESLQLPANARRVRLEDLPEVLRTL